MRAHTCTHARKYISGWVVTRIDSGKHTGNYIIARSAFIVIVVCRTNVCSLLVWMCALIRSFSVLTHSLAHHSIPFHFRSFFLYLCKHTNLCYCYSCVAVFSCFFSHSCCWMVRPLFIRFCTNHLLRRAYNSKPDARLNRSNSNNETGETFADLPLFFSGPKKCAEKKRREDVSLKKIALVFLLSFDDDDLLCKRSLRLARTFSVQKK